MMSERLKKIQKEYGIDSEVYKETKALMNDLYAWGLDDSVSMKADFDEQSELQGDISSNKKNIYHIRETMDPSSGSLFVDVYVSEPDSFSGDNYDLMCSKLSNGPQYLVRGELFSLDIKDIQGEYNAHYSDKGYPVRFYNGESFDEIFDSNIIEERFKELSGNIAIDEDVKIYEPQFEKHINVVDDPIEKENDSTFYEKNTTKMWQEELDKENIDYFSKMKDRIKNEDKDARDFRVKSDKSLGRVVIRDYDDNVSVIRTDYNPVVNDLLNKAKRMESKNMTEDIQKGLG